MEWVENIVYVLVHYIDRLIPWEQLYEVVADGYIDGKLNWLVSKFWQYLIINMIQCMVVVGCCSLGSQIILTSECSGN